ncbi:MAG: hypothetical protein ACRDJX_11595 [Solirubrobacteraceae bacterium]
MDAIDRFGQELVQAGRRRHGGRRPLRALFGTGLTRISPRWRVPAHARIVLAALALVLASAAIALAATGVILTGSPVRPAVRPTATANEGIPVRSGVRLLPLRAADPAGGLPWGMRIIHTTRGLICAQIGRVLDGQLGELGVDGAFHNDGRFHALPADAFPDVMTGTCASPGDTYSSDIVGLQLSAASSPRQGAGLPADRREISFGLLGVHAVSITYRTGSETRTQPVLPGLGAYLIVQRYSSGRPLGSVSETDGRDEPGDYSGPAGPNGALTAITYNYAGRTCVDRGKLRLASCGLSEVPPPRPAPLPVVHEPLRAHLDIHNHVITGAQISFHAPYPVTDADESYSVMAPTCRHGLGGSGTHVDLTRGSLVTIPLGDILSQACSRSVTFTVDYVRYAGGLPQPARIGSITIREPPGTHAAPLPPRVLARERRYNPTHSLHATVHLTLLPQSRAACSAAFLLYPCYKGEVEFTAPYAFTPNAAIPEPAGYQVQGFAKCKTGGRPETSWSVGHKVGAHETVSTVSLGLFVVAPSCASSEGFEVTYINPEGSSTHIPHESVILGAVALSKATRPNGTPTIGLHPKSPSG